MIRKLAAIVLTICLMVGMVPAMAAQDDVQTVEFGPFNIYLPASEGIQVSDPNGTGDYVWGNLTKDGKFVSIQIEKTGPVPEEKMNWLIDEQGYVVYIPAGDQPIVPYGEAKVCYTVMSFETAGFVYGEVGEQTLYMHDLEMQCYIGDWYINLYMSIDNASKSPVLSEQQINDAAENLVALLRLMYPADVTPDPAVFDAPAEAVEPQKTDDSVQEERAEQEAAKNYVVITADSGKIRTEASISGGLIKTAYKGETFELIEQSGDWYVVKVDGRTGYIHSGVAVIQ